MGRLFIVVPVRDLEDLVAFLNIISGMALLLILGPGHHVEIRHIGALNRNKETLVSVPTPEPPGRCRQGQCHRP